MVENIEGDILLSTWFSVWNGLGLVREYFRLIRIQGLTTSNLLNGFVFLEEDVKYFDSVVVLQSQCNLSLSFQQGPCNVAC